MNKLVQKIVWDPATCKATQLMLSEVQKLLGLNICSKIDDNLPESQTLK